MNKIKVLIISTNSDEAGAPRHVESLINGLSSKCEFIFLSGEKGPVYHRLNKNFKCFHLVGLKSSISPFKDLWILVKLAYMTNKIKPDLIHLHSSKAGMLGRIISIILKIPCIYTVHGWGWRGLSKLNKKVVILVERMLSKAPNCRYILVANNLYFDAINTSKIKEKNIRIIYNGIENIPINTSKKKTKPLKFIMPARVCDAKDHITLLKAFSKISYPYKLKLCGHGTNEVAFIKKAKSILGKSLSNVEFLGQTSEIDLLLDECNVMVLSSHFEALPISIIEGMRASMPIIATDVGGVDEVVSNNINGFLTLKSNADDLANKLNKINNHALIEKFGKNSRTIFEKKFLNQTMSLNVYKLYDELCNKNRHLKI